MTSAPAALNEKRSKPSLEPDPVPWPKTVSIPRVVDPSPEDVEAFVHSGMPAIFESSHLAEIAAGIDLETLTAAANEDMVTALVDIPPIGPRLEAYSLDDVRNMTVAEYFAFMSDPDRKGPCYSIAVHTESVGLGKLDVLERLHPSLTSGHMFVGTSGASIGLHLHRQAWVGGMIGYKDVFLVDKRYSEHLQPVPLSPTWSRVDPKAPDFEANPGLKRVVPYVGRVRPGDILLIPDFMWHCLWPVDTCVTLHGAWDALVSVPGQDPYDWKDFTLNIPKVWGWKQALEIGRQVIWNGALGKPPKRYHPVDAFRHPYGVFVWEHLRANPVGEVEDLALRQRLDQRSKGM